MPKVPYADSNGELSVEVRLKGPAEVYLMNSQNFQKYILDESFKYYGGHYTYTPVHISVYGSGRWYLIVEGSPYEYRFSKE